MLLDTNHVQQTGHVEHGTNEHSVKSGEHQALMALVPESQATHRAIRSGSWFDTTTWAGGEIPGNNARVVVPDGLSLSYDGESNARLKTVRLDGTLTFAADKDTKLIVDTFVEAASGTLNIGTIDRPIQADKTAQILIKGQGDINTQVDPTQLGRGLVTMGEVNIYGAEKTDFIALQRDARAGDSELVLREIPTGWNVGDKLVLGGTRYLRDGSDADNSRFGDEELTITEIQGNRIRFTNDDITGEGNTVLRFDHTRPDVPERNQLKLYVANTTRNVSFATMDGALTPIAQRGHVMLMHNSDVQVHNAGFYDLGRSDKTRLVDDPERNVDGSAGVGTNRRGRYPLHFHRNGTGYIDDPAVVATGNAVVGSPGWGIAHHDGHVVLEDNVVFDVVGSAIAAEAGNEIGSWRNNITIKTTGINTRQIQQQDARRSERFDFGFNGESYWVQGAAQVAMSDNVAISANDSGVMIFSDSFQPGEHYQEVETIPTRNLLDNVRRQVASEGQTEVDINTIPLRQLSGFQSYNTGSGIQFWGHLRNGDGELEFESQNIETAHTLRSYVNNFKIWNIRKNGIKPQYSSSLDFNRGLILGADLDNRVVAFGGEKGIKQSEATYNTRYRNLTVKGFNEGMSIETLLTDKNYITSSLEDSYFSDNIYNLAEVGSQYVPRRLVDDFTEFLEIKNTVFEESLGNRAPVAIFEHQTAGGLALFFNASRSYDSDPLTVRNESPEFALPSKGIAAYGWDFDSDGQIDDFGRKVSHYFDGNGTQDVTLTVWDNHGATQSVTQTIQVEQTDYPNPFLGSNFSDRSSLTRETTISSQRAGEGWFSSDRVRRLNNTALLSNLERRNAAIAQVVQNDNVHRGPQTLSLRLKNTNGGFRLSNLNKISVQLWGIDGQFSHNIRSSDEPYRVGSLPMSSQKLLDTTIGGQNSSASWNDLEWTVDLGQGYQFLLVQVSGEGLNDQGDWVAVDDVRLTGQAENALNSAFLPIIDAEGPAIESIDSANLVSSEDGSTQPIAQLTFDDSAGIVVRDRSILGGDNAGTLQGDSFWSNGISGGGISLDGRGDWIELANTEDINLAIHDKRTVSIWFKSNEILNNRKQVIYEEGAGVRGFNIYTDADRLYVGGWNQPTDESSWTGTWLESDSILAPDTWYHVAFVLDSSNGLSADSFRGYLNGQEFASGVGSQLWEHPGGIGVGGINGNTRFHNGMATGDSYGLLGSIDELTIFNDALSAKSVQSLSEFG